jgi:hypothetical protein
VAQFLDLVSKLTDRPMRLVNIEPTLENDDIVPLPPPRVAHVATTHTNFNRCVMKVTGLDAVRSLATDDVNFRGS